MRIIWTNLCLWLTVDRHASPFQPSQVVDGFCGKVSPKSVTIWWVQTQTGRCAKRTGSSPHDSVYQIAFFLQADSACSRVAFTGHWPKQGRWNISTGCFYESLLCSVVFSWNNRFMSCEFYSKYNNNCVYLEIPNNALPSFHCMMTHELSSCVETQKAQLCSTATNNHDSIQQTTPPSCKNWVNSHIDLRYVWHLVCGVQERHHTTLTAVEKNHTTTFACLSLFVLLKVVSSLSFRTNTATPSPCKLECHLFRK